MPGQSIRRDSVRKKLNPVDREFKGKNVLLVDDSIVRGNTSRKIVEMARQSGANKVVFASAAPPVRYPNVYGIDMPAASELIANGRSEEEVAHSIGADRLFYQRVEDLLEAVNILPSAPARFDASCFNAEYVTGRVSQEYLEELEQRRSDGARQQSPDMDADVGLHNQV